MAKKFIINEEQFNNLFMGNFTDHGGKEIKVGEIKILTTEEFYKKAEEIWEILCISYESHGGLKTYRNFKNFVELEHVVKVVENSNKILACSTYRRIEGSLKMVAIGCIQDKEGKLALQQIIQHDIVSFDLHFWAEVSDAIEHYFKKYNGYPIPNTMASEILSIPSSKIVLSTKDNVHYSRPIGINHEMYEKMIFGFKSEEIFERVISETENYGDFMKEINQIKESINSYTPKQAIYIIENIYRAHTEDGFNELIPSWHQALIQSVKVLKAANNMTPSQTYQDYIKYGSYLLNTMQPLIMHKFR